MELSTSWEAASLAATRELPNILWDPKVHYRAHKRPPLVPVLSQINSVYTTLSYLSKIHFNIVAWRPVASQRPRNKKLYDIHCWVTAPQTSMFLEQRENTAIMKWRFLRRPCRGVITRTRGRVTSIRVEAGSNTSTIALRIVGGDEKWTQCLGV
jgi:hypothetical protein